MPGALARSLAANLRHATLHLAEDRDHSDLEEWSLPAALGWLRDLAVPVGNEPVTCLRTDHCLRTGGGDTV